MNIGFHPDYILCVTQYFGQLAPPSSLPDDQSPDDNVGVCGRNAVFHTGYKGSIFIHSTYF